MSVPGLQVVRNVLPPLNAVKAFKAVARLGSLTQAASELNVTPSAVSQQIRLLEEHIGKKLFVIDQRGLSLTAISKQAFPQVSEAIGLIGAAFLREAPRASRVAISTLPALASRWLNAKLSVFMAANDTLDMFIDCSPRLVDFTTESFDMAGENTTANSMCRWRRENRRAM